VIGRSDHRRLRSRNILVDADNWTYDCMPPADVAPRSFIGAAKGRKAMFCLSKGRDEREIAI
jgi:hypothetical protein